MFCHNCAKLAHGKVQWPDIVMRRKSYHVSWKLEIYTSCGPLKEDSTSMSLIHVNNVITQKLISYVGLKGFRNTALIKKDAK
jgi:hypothetical protein